jgi:hypothetical protein
VPHLCDGPEQRFVHNLSPTLPCDHVTQDDGQALVDLLLTNHLHNSKALQRKVMAGGRRRRAQAHAIDVEEQI